MPSRIARINCAITNADCAMKKAGYRTNNFMVRGEDEKECIVPVNTFFSLSGVEKEFLIPAFDKFGFMLVGDDSRLYIKEKI